MSHKQLLSLRVNGEVDIATASNSPLFSTVEMEVVLLLRYGLTYMMLRDSFAADIVLIRERFPSPETRVPPIKPAE